MAKNDKRNVDRVGGVDTMVSTTNVADIDARAPRDNDPMVPTRNVSKLKDHLAAGEWIKKPDLCAMGAFNIVDASTRMDRYRGRDINQIIFEVQFLGTDENKDLRGTRAQVSMEANAVRTKYYNLFKKAGPFGPLVLVYIESDDADKNGAYVFAQLDDTDTIAQGSTPPRGGESGDDFLDR